MKDEAQLRAEADQAASVKVNDKLADLTRKLAELADKHTADMILRDRMMASVEARLEARLLPLLARVDALEKDLAAVKTLNEGLNQALIDQQTKASNAIANLAKQLGLQLDEAGTGLSSQGKAIDKLKGNVSGLTAVSAASVLGLLYTMFAGK